jgi:hypothetical protein
VIVYQGVPSLPPWEADVGEIVASTPQEWLDLIEMYKDEQALLATNCDGGDPMRLFCIPVLVLPLVAGCEFVAALSEPTPRGDLLDAAAAAKSSLPRGDDVEGLETLPAEELADLEGCWAAQLPADAFNPGGADPRGPVDSLHALRFEAAAFESGDAIGLADFPEGVFLTRGTLSSDAVEGIFDGQITRETVRFSSREEIDDTGRPVAYAIEVVSGDEILVNIGVPGVDHSFGLPIRYKRIECP